MNFQSFVVLSSIVLTATVALKQPLLCTDGRGNSLVCTIIDAVNQKSPADFALSTTNITVAKNGQASFFDALESMSILSSSTASHINKERSYIGGVDATSARSVDGIIKQIGNVGFASRNLLYTAITSIRRFQNALHESHIRQADRTYNQSENALNGLKYEEDRQKVRQMQLNHFADIKRCSENFERELESLQNSTRVMVEGYYEAGIDGVDHIGKCYESNSETHFYGTECLTKGLVMMIKLNQSALKFSMAASKFTAMEAKSFDKYLCTRLAFAKFSSELKKFSRYAETTTARPVSSSSMSTKHTTAGPAT